MKDNIIIKNEKLIVDLRNKLDMDLFNIIKYDPEFKFYGSENKKEKYKFYISNRNNKKKKESIYTNVTFNFWLKYEEWGDVYRNYKDKFNSEHITDEEIDIIVKANQDIKYAYIDGLYVTPKNTGVGSKIIKCFIKRIEEIGEIKAIFLTPKSSQAEKFWHNHGFCDLKTCKDIDLADGYHKVLYLK
jgi:hypothetical protein